MENRSQITKYTLVKSDAIESIRNRDFLNSVELKEESEL